MSFEEYLLVFSRQAFADKVVVLFFFLLCFFHLSTNKYMYFFCASAYLLAFQKQSIKTLL